jgi:hypothetical protein
VSQQTAYEIEQRIRKFVSEILTPFNERIMGLNKEVRHVVKDTTTNHNQIEAIKLAIQKSDASIG